MNEKIFTLKDIIFLEQYNYSGWISYDKREFLFNSKYRKSVIYRIKRVEYLINHEF